MVNPIVKYAARAFLSWLKEQVDSTPNEFDNQVYEQLRQLAINYGLIDEAGGDDPGPVAQGGGNGGP